MTKNYTPNIGELCHPGARRDAIHFAVAPVVAAVELYPGEHVGLLPNRLATNKDYRESVSSVDLFLPGPIPIERIGIVDPFLKERVAPGETFWLFLYPNTVQDLHHVWVHPSFIPQLPPKKEPNNA